MNRATLKRFVDACRAGDHAAVAALIAEGVDVNTPLGAGPPGDPKPLLWTVRPTRWTAGHRRVLESLLDAGADPRGGNLSPIVAAAEQGHAEAVDLLIAHGARVGIAEAIAIGDIDGVETALADDPAVARRIWTLGVGIHGGPGDALHFAALSRMDGERLAAVAERLIAAGASVVGDPAQGIVPPLRRAARADNASVAGVLLAHGAPVDDAILWQTLMGDSRRVLDLIGPVVSNVDVVGDPKLGNTLVDETIRFGLLASARWLVERGAALDRADRRGWNSLHYAASRGVAPELVALLIARGAPLDARDAEGRTAGDIARENGRERLIPLLQSGSTH